MLKKLLSEKSLYYGEVKMPKGFEIDRYQFKTDIIENAFLLKKRLSNNVYDYSYNDYTLLDSSKLYPLVTYICDFFNLKFKKNLILEKCWGNIYNTQETSILRNTINMLNLKESPDYVLIYGIDVQDKNSIINIEYNDNRRKNRSYHIPIQDNHFVMFPSTLKYFISKNNALEPNIFLTLTFSYIE